MDTYGYIRQRDLMIERQIRARGVTSPLVLDAMREVPREVFLPEKLREFAYEDTPLPIAGGQTISQPYIVAMMIDALDLKGGEKVLDIGTGSGYAAAVLSRIAAEVYSVERVAELAEQAKSHIGGPRFWQCACVAGRWHTGLARTRAL
ncbi:protein-L-isoaspartate O-methyltransferase [Halothiobacillus sp.]|uniref:protein-L-isoaspartate O-methyltransferase family protein n=1 Tax=Halothiobacillus sp. TaxID=1891311 RepID=UPI00261CD438|nr:protein-L-isoaspartate O-methyltransferase [Halothiobacillus sp.]MDD4967597.1 protein-L-isoaspartate O-methyltransferase [Halothiobacillus sp.]